MTILQNIEEIELDCSNCNTSNIVTDNTIGEMICSSCGCVILENTEDRKSEHRVFFDRDDNTRTGPGSSPKRHDRGLFTTIGIQNRDSTGKPLLLKTAVSFSRLRKWDNRSQIKNSADRSLRNALSELDKIQSKLGLSDSVIERASIFYRKAAERKLVKGRSVKAITAACLYAACRDLGHTRTLTEIAQQLELGRKEVARSYRSLFMELGFAISIADPIKSINKIASKIEIKEKTVRKAVQILNEAHSAEITAGKNPETLAAAAIYAACVITGENKSQQKVANAANTSSVSIRNRILDFKKHLNVFVVEEIEHDTSYK